MTHPELIVTTLDSHLDREVSLVLYGRSGISLGFANAPAAAAATMDLDSILPLATWPALQANENFWNAVAKTNAELATEGLYISHLFGEDQVFLRDDWLEHLVPISRPPLRFLRLSRPSTLDLILTKMMRGEDPQDMDDVAFLIRHDGLTRAQLEETMRRARLPEIPELHDAFARAKPRVLALAVA